MRKLATFGALFVGVALPAFVLLSARPAEAVKRNYAGAGCWKSFAGAANYYCPVMTDWSTYTLASFKGAYFDFVCAPGTTAFYGLHKVTSTGSFYADVRSLACTSYNLQDKWVTATNVIKNPSARGYLWATSINVSELYGVQSQFTTVEPH